MAKFRRRKAKRVFTKRGKRIMKTSLGRALQPAAGFPDRFKTKLRYVEHIAVAAATTDYSSVWRANGPFDPRYAAGGHQPMYYDQFIALYNTYSVTSCKIRATMACTSGTMVFNVYPQTDTAVGGTIDLDEERYRSRYKIINANSNPATIVRNMTTKKIFGIKDRDPLENDYNSNVATTPALPWYWMVVAQHPDLTTAIVGVLILELTYTIEFFDKERVAQS